TGRKIAVLRSGNRSAGTHQFLWSGTDNNKQIVPAGIYLIQVQVEDEIGRKAQAIQTVMLR
ncbi:MAG: FlgD immunoglobulin-like domain containing protein, partial [Armatimonadota bacterium]|nr:FlgD immunoglobulin-like domain containing protein [Armatimonadota bacterium]